MSPLVSCGANRRAAPLRPVGLASSTLWNHQRGTTSTALTVARSSKSSPATGDDKQNEYAAAVAQTTITVVLSMLFAAGLAITRGFDDGVAFLSGYLLEESLSVDNLFVFVLIFDFFAVPMAYQKRVLQWGILGSVVLRFLFISAGALALENFRVVLLGFAGVLLFSSFKLLSAGDEDEEEDFADNNIVKFASNLVDATSEYEGDRFFTVVDGVRRATPLLLVLVCVELTDIVFALDSVPAVFGVTSDPLIVFSSNMFAILGLRSLYTVLANAVQDLEYLEPAVAVVLGFVGLKLGAEYFGIEISNEVSLAVISGLLGTGVAASLAAKETKTEDEED